LTAPELFTILRHDFKPFTFLINNAGYTIEPAILGRILTQTIKTEETNVVAIYPDPRCPVTELESAAMVGGL